MNPWALWLDPWDSYLDAWSRALGGDIFRLHGTQSADDMADRHGATPSKVCLEGDNFVLFDFSTGLETSTTQPPTLLVTPYALHDWRVADLAHDHSLVETLSAGGIQQLYVLAWKSATFTMRHNRIDAQFAALKVVTDYFEKPNQCVGLCQGGWLALAFAARFPNRISKLALIGAPIDFSKCASSVLAMDDMMIDAAINWLSLAGGGVIRGWSIQSLWQIKYGARSNKAEALQESEESLAADPQLSQCYEDWDRDVLDLPSAYFGEVLKHLYRDNEIFNGSFKVLGETISLRAITCPILVMIGRQDHVASEAQMTALRHAVSTADNVFTLLFAECGHLALFLGRNTLREQWPEIAHWLKDPLAGHDLVDKSLRIG